MSGDERDNDIENDADKKVRHNASERKRRDNLKESFTMLRDALPFSEGDRERASRARILKKAADHITTMQRRIIVHEQHIAALKEGNEKLAEEIRGLEEARTKENLASANLAVESAKKTLENINSFREPEPEYRDTSESENSSEDSSDNSRDSNDNPRKRLKTTTDPSRM